MLPLFKAVLQIIFSKTIQELYRFCFHLFCRHKIGSFEHGFDLWKLEEVTGGKIRQIRGEG